MAEAQYKVNEAVQLQGQQFQQAPQPQVQQEPPKCAFIDFVPQRLGAGTTFGVPKYPPFSALLGPANQWLASNPQLEVVTCESCEIKLEGRYQVNNDKTSYYESGSMSTSFIRLLRYKLFPMLVFYPNLSIEVLIFSAGYGSDHEPTRIFLVLRR